MKRKAVGLMVGSGVLILAVAGIILESVMEQKKADERYDAVMSSMAESESELENVANETTVPPFDETDDRQPTSGEFLPEPSYTNPTERDYADNEKVFTIKSDTNEFKVGENSLLSYDAFINDEYLQYNIRDFYLITLESIFQKLIHTKTV